MGVRKSIILKLNDHKKTTIQPIIKKYVRPGTSVNTDSHKSYLNLDKMVGVEPPYKHNVVCHKDAYVDPVTGAHTNHIECEWQKIKTKKRAMYGIARSKITSYTDEFLWRNEFGKIATKDTIATLDILFRQLGESHRNNEVMAGED